MTQENTTETKTEDVAKNATPKTTAEKPKKGFSIGLGKLTIIASAVIVTLGYFAGNSRFEHKETVKVTVQQKSKATTKVLEKTNAINEKEKEFEKLKESLVSDLFEKTKDDLSICRDIELLSSNCLTSNETSGKSNNVIGRVIFSFADDEDDNITVSILNKETNDYLSISAKDAVLHEKLMSIYNESSENDKSRFLDDKINELKNFQEELNAKEQ